MSHMLERTKLLKIKLPIIEDNVYVNGDINPALAIPYSREDIEGISYLYRGIDNAPQISFTMELQQKVVKLVIEGCEQKECGIM